MTAPDLHAGLRPVVQRCLDRFRAWTGREAEAIAAAPGRVNLIGEHTDYNDGFVLPMAIDRWCVAAGALDRPTGPGPSRVFSDDLGEEARFDAAHPAPRAFDSTAWAKYPAGVIWTILEAADRRERPRLDIALASSVPLGAGLSSSAAVEVATATLARALMPGLASDPAEIARLCRRAEHEYAGVPCGVMDQMISACAVEGAALLIDCRSLAARPVALPDPDRAVIVIADTGVRHDLASGAYARRREACQRAAALLGVASLRDVGVDRLGTIDESLPEEEAACARHVVTENVRVLAFVDALAAGDLERAGGLMYESHASLRDDYRVSWPELDRLVGAARGVSGVFGSRMTGGGFGGCTVTLCRPDAATALEEAVRWTVPAGAREPFVAAAVGGASGASIRGGVAMGLWETRWVVP